MDRTVAMKKPDGTPAGFYSSEQYIVFPCPVCGPEQLLHTIPGAKCPVCGIIITGIIDGTPVRSSKGLL